MNNAYLKILPNVPRSNQLIDVFWSKLWSNTKTELKFHVNYILFIFLLQNSKFVGGNHMCFVFCTNKYENSVWHGTYKCTVLYGVHTTQHVAGDHYIWLISPWVIII